jgi:ribose transport system permease protein
MSAAHETKAMMTPIGRAAKWIGLFLGVIISGLGLILGFWQGVPAQQVIFLTAATFALVIWVWNSYLNRWLVELSINDDGNDKDPVSSRAALREFALRNLGLLISLGLLITAFFILAAAIDSFLSLVNIIVGLILVLLLIVAVKVSQFFVDNRSAFIGLTVLVALFIVASMKIDGFLSLTNIKSMLVFASFLGLACLGQTLVALMGGLDLSIPFIIGSANVGLLYLIGLGVPPWLAVIIVLLLGVVIGIINGFLSFRLQGSALILTLGVGFAVSGITQILTSIGTEYAGNVFGTVPNWLKNLASMNGNTFGLDVPPVIFIWVIVAAVLIYGLKNSVYGRNLYALGGNRTSADRLSISERRYWIGAYAISGGVAALTGELLLGWSGGGFIGVGQPYLFMTLAAVVMGGTSLLGGYGGYGFTVIGVLVLQVLTSFLVGIGLRFEWQQFIFGLLIVPMVALYARSPHIRTQI